MKWDFFYDEDEDIPYESIQDWYKDIKYSIITTVIMVVVGVTVYNYF